jgi:radical SAM superfamily enzyme YgiQ (UPF0313 family)
MHIPEQLVIRPPSEAYSMIIQVSVGCSHNRCSFCGTYKGREFYFKDMETIKADIDEISAQHYGFQRAFLTDGDVLILPAGKIIEIMRYIREKNPSIERIGVYGNTKAILKKSVEELKRSGRRGSGSSIRESRAATGRCCGGSRRGPSPTASSRPRRRSGRRGYCSRRRFCSA